MSDAQIPHAAAMPMPLAGALSLSPEQFEQLARLDDASAWLANLTSPQTRRAYRSDILHFFEFLGQGASLDVLARVHRPHVTAWRDALLAQGLAPDTVRRKLAAEARALLEAPDPETLKGKRDRAILAALLFLGLRRQELCRLRVGDVGRRRGQPQLRVVGKGSKVRDVARDACPHGRIRAYLAAAGHGGEPQAWLFRPVKNNATGRLDKALNPQSVYADVVRRYARKLGLEPPSGAAVGAHTLRATAATHALLGGADMAAVQGWLGHASAGLAKAHLEQGVRQGHVRGQLAGVSRKQLRKDCGLPQAGPKQGQALRAGRGLQAKKALGEAHPPLAGAADEAVHLEAGEELRRRAQTWAPRRERASRLVARPLAAGVGQRLGDLRGPLQRRWQAVARGRRAFWSHGFVHRITLLQISVFTEKQKYDFQFLGIF